MADRAVLINGADTVVLPWWPDTIEWQSLASQWREQNRPGRVPLLLKESSQLPEITIGCILASRSVTFVGDGGTVDSTLSTLLKMESAKTPTQLMLGSRDTGRWRITELQYTELDHDREGGITKAELTLTLKRAQDVVAAIGPIPPRKKSTPIRSLPPKKKRLR